MNNKQTIAYIICGFIGAGKTTFSQGFAKGLGIKERILSPTFLIIKEFGVPSVKEGFNNLIHIDCYRLEKSQDLLDLGWEDMASNPNNIILVEWAEKIKDILPDETKDIYFSFVDENRREIECSRN